MVRDTRSFKNKVKRRWLLSYLVITLIPLILVFTVAIVTLSVNSSSLTYSNTITASYVQSTFRSVINRINEIKAEIIVNPDFEELRSVTNIDTISSLDLSYHAAGIRRLEQTSSSVNRLFLFSPKGNWYISDLGWGKITELSLMNTLSVEQESLNNWMGKEIWDVYIYDISESEVLILLPMTFIPSFNPNNLSVAVTVSKSELFSSAIDDYHDVVIYSQRLDSLVYSLSGRYDKTYNESFSSMDLGSTERLESFIASVASDVILSLKCIVLMDKNAYFHNLYLFIEILIVLLFGSSIFAAILSFRSTKKDWLLYEKAALASGVNLEDVPNTSLDYAPFVSSVSNLKAQSEKLTNEISQQKKL